MNNAYKKVREFHLKFGHPVAGRVQDMGVFRRGQRYMYMLEEMQEFLKAENAVDQADAMIDLMYFALGTMVEIGVEPEQIFNIVHEANMSKVWEDGSVRYHPETGKILKPPTFIKPEPLIKLEILRQERERK